MTSWQKGSSFAISAILVRDFIPYKDSAMSINRAIVVLLQFILVCAPLAEQATALDHDNDLGNIDRELFQDTLKQRSSLRIKNTRNRVRVIASLQQDDLLQELLTTEVIGHGSIPKDSETETSQSNSRENSRQENQLLKEFTTEKSNP